jgi:putative ABC transport system substrate-binding protein
VIRRRSEIRALHRTVNSLQHQIFAQFRGRVNRELIIALATRYNVPTIYGDRLFAESGGLIAYGDDRADEFRHAAEYIDRILKGAKPADLPIQQPTKFELVINHKTAKALGLSLSSGLLSIADEVIE